jgi:hypothetical protein
LKILKNIEKYFTKKSIGKVKKFKNFFWMCKKSIESGTKGISRGIGPRWVRITWFRGWKLRQEKVFFRVSIFFEKILGK